MHELALCEAIVDAVGARADGRRVDRVDIRVGHLRQVVPDALQFAWEALTAGTELDGCVLAVEHVAAVVRCDHCGATTELDLPILQCGACDSFGVALVSGEEFDLASFDAVR